MVGPGPSSRSPRTSCARLAPPQRPRPRAGSRATRAAQRRAARRRPGAPATEPARGQESGRPWRHAAVRGSTTTAETLGNPPRAARPAVRTALACSTRRMPAHDRLLSGTPLQDGRACALSVTLRRHARWRRVVVARMSSHDAPCSDGAARGSAYGTACEAAELCHSACATPATSPAPDNVPRCAAGPGRSSVGITR
jgi:hypothetical protein